MNPKKFKLTKENLDAIHLMQHIVFINISSYNNMKHMNFNDDSVQNLFEISCDKYIKLHESFSIRDWRCYYNDISDPMINKYVITTDQIEFHLIIEINKPYYECSKIGIRFHDKIIQPVLIDIFNIQFSI